MRYVLALAALLVGGASPPGAGTFRKTSDGVVVTPASGPEKAVRLSVYGDSIIRVTASPAARIDAPRSLMVTAKPVARGFTVAERSGHVLVKTSKIVADVDLADGGVVFRDTGGRILLAESAPGSFAPVAVEGRRFFAIRQQWNRGTDEGLYGLGQHQNRQMDYLGEDVELAQHNMDVAVPFLVSTRNYGILWDNASITRFGNPKPYGLAGETLKVTGEGGRPGFTARYYLGDRLALARQEGAINYQYIRDQARWPAEAKSAKGEAQRVVWTGRLRPEASGVHKFRLYSSSYVKLFVDGRLVLERWRQNWNPWYHNFELPLTAGKAADIRIEWAPNGGYIALFHNDPQPDADRRSLSFASELGKAVDYYFVAGRDTDEVISGYRRLTGKAAMLPKWAYGFWQSRQRYSTQEEVLDVARQYRSRGLPLDSVVQDWFYWPEDQWGSHEFDPRRYPDPKGMIDGLHAMNVRFMISVWPKFYPNTANYRELAAKGHVYPGNIEAGNRDWVGPGYLNTDYDPYSAEARAIYWRQVEERLGRLGVDAWWMDATEPDIHSNLSIDERKAVMTPTAIGPGAAWFNSFPLVHAEGVHQGWRRFKPDVRSFILTRSAFGGLQRAGSAVWSGDVAARWDDLRDQISAGINFSMSGIPNWTHDIGGFAVEDRYAKQDPAHVAEWRELNLRWFQFGAFSPLFRSHGEFPRREIYELAPAGSPTYRSMGYYDRLRYRLLPYIYTLAADTWLRDGTIMRGLVMDFPADPAVRRLDDQYMFGPAFLVAPVTAFKARSRPVYLPRGADWYDFHSGRLYPGGRRIDADAPYERMPLFVRAGSIVPIGPAIQHSGEAPDGPITLNVYTGADGAFSVYEDDGISLQYEKGAYSRIPIRWDQGRGLLTIGRREGGWRGMTAERTFRLRWIGPGRSSEPEARPDSTVAYRGRAIAVRR
ncbi:MAG TPA: TIM-barrel domain-containing protein [Allosphingosinicella sp.]|jgi:alpha-D-xyloside xylohydrolase|nr:TIM-barrel domain-containing protein [Allosphingosinicella sp.]